jgi:multicomponent K+:H+ antiporter subunit D
VAIGVLLASLVLLTVFAGPITLWLDEAAAQLYQPSHYIDAVLGAAGGNE